MNFIYSLVLITHLGTVGDTLANFPTREACMLEAEKVKAQKVKVVCVPKQQLSSTELQKETDTIINLMKYMMTEFKKIETDSKKND